MNFDLIISINIHEKKNFLLEQIKNIKYFTKSISNILIIYNCNEYMFNEICDVSDNKITIIRNPEIINKKRFHGSLTQGIFSNLKYVVKNNISFQYFLVMSSRNILINNISLDSIKENMIFTKNNIENLNKSQRKFYYNRNYDTYQICDGTTPGPWIGPTHYWFYNYIEYTSKLWFKEFKQFDFIIGGKHEALCFPYKVIHNIYNYLNKNFLVEQDIYTTNHCAEEIAPQTLAYYCKEDGISYSFIPQIIKIERNIEDLNEYYKKNKIKIHF